MDNVILTLNDASQAIGELQGVVSKSQEQYLRDRIESSTQMLGPLNFPEWFERLQQAIAKRLFAERRLEETKGLLRQAREELDHTKSARLIKLAICAVCWLVCAATEFTVTYTTLPFVLDVPEDSVLGIALSAVVVAMLTVVEWAIARALEEPYQAARTSAGGMTPQQRRLAVGLMSVFLAVLLVGNLYTVRLIASARQAAIRVRLALEQASTAPPAAVAGKTAPAPTQPDIAVDERVIDRAIMALSIAVVIDGSLLFLVTMTGLATLSRRWRALMLVFVHGRRLPDRERAFHDAQVEEAVQQHVWDERGTRIAAVQAEFRNRCLLELQAVLDRAQPRPLSAKEFVDQTLARPALLRRAGEAL